jgi:hypothetical protein
MKNNQKITRVQLNTGPKEEDILIGIVSSDPDYKLSLSINKKLRVSLKNIPPLKIPHKNNSELSFSRFIDSSRSPELLLSLYSNRSGKNYLLKKLINVDYVLQVQDYENFYDITRIFSDLREIESIVAVFNIDKNIIKEKELQYLTF